jgi:hypothetical protein
MEGWKPEPGALCQQCHEQPAFPFDLSPYQKINNGGMVSPIGDPSRILGVATTVFVAR